MAWIFISITQNLAFAVNFALTKSTENCCFVLFFAMWPPDVSDHL